MPVGDLTPYGDQDAHLVFDEGPIRFYIMNLENPGEDLKALTRHTHCSQCLASADAEPWWIAVAAPHLESDQIDINTIKLFCVEPRQAIKIGTRYLACRPLLQECHGDVLQPVAPQGTWALFVT